MSTWLIIGIVAIVVLGAISFLGGEDDEMLAPEDQFIYENEGSDNISAEPKKVSGSSLGVQNFTKAAYDKANAEGRLIIVFFDSPTCGEQCPKEIAAMKSVFAQYAERPIAGFIADITKEKAFANSLKIFAPDGKAVVFNNELKAWSPLSWGQFDYESYIEIYTYGSEDE